MPEEMKALLPGNFAEKREPEEAFRNTQV